MKSFNQYYKEVAKNKAQKAAVDAEENTILIAGPGSGKTRVVSVKAARLHLQERGVACISFGNPTEQRIRDQLLEMGIQEHEHLFIGTVHGFCLKYVVKPFINIIPSDWPEDFSIASQDYHIPEMLDLAKKQLGYSAKFKELQKNQRLITSGEIAAEGHDRQVQLVYLYEQLMLEQNLVDFEMIVRWSIRAVEKYEIVQSYLKHLFEWIIVDEYQDLGGGLHYLAKILTQKIGIRMLAVGDPNQLIFEFNGANVKYLNELIDKGFKNLQTEYCYRFGEKLIAASAGALGKIKLPYSPVKNVDTPGEVIFRKAEGSCTAQRMAEFVVTDLMFDMRNEYGHDASIAILYPASGDLSDKVRAELQGANIKFADEKTSQLPGSPIFDWYRSVADICVGISENNHILLNTFSEIAFSYKTLLMDAGIDIDEDDFIGVQDALMQTLKASLKYNTNGMKWLKFVVKELRIIELLKKANNRKGDLRDTEEVLSSTKTMSIRDIGNKPNEELNITLTTIHSSKGREFDCVILVGVQEGEIPWKNQDNTKFRNTFYVACTRARKALCFVFSDPLETMKWGQLQQQKASPYIADVKHALSENGFL